MLITKALGFSRQLDIQKKKDTDSSSFALGSCFWQFPQKGCGSLSQHATLHGDYSQHQIKARNGHGEIGEDSPSLSVLTL